MSGLNVTVENLGLPGNAGMGTVINSPALVSPGGVGGLIGNSYTTTSANFTMPAVSSTVNVQVVASAWAAVGQPIFVQGAGFFSVNAIPDATHITLTNLGYAVNAVPTTVIASPQPVVPTGFQGPTGATGVASLNAISPTTTKGDLIVDNGANHPLASDVRLGVGSDGKAVVADSSQSTGLNYAQISPNTVAAAGDIAVFSAVSGTPVLLGDSKLLISAAGLIQSTPTGGNARSGVDLQVSRAANTQVASGSGSFVVGVNGTASSNQSAVVGGSGGTASNFQSAVLGGVGGIASGQQSVALGGSNNQAQGNNAATVGGNGCVASGTNAIAGGASGTASGSNAVAVGALTTASGNYTTAFGNSAVANLWGEVAHGSQSFAAPGDQQAMELIWSQITNDATAGVEMFLDGNGGSQRAILPLNATWMFHIYLVMRTSAGVGVVIQCQGGIQNVAGTVTLINSSTQAVLVDGSGGSVTSANFVVSADNTNKSLKLAVTGLVGTNFRHVAHARIVQVIF